jgi:hypothetical protein
LMMMTSIDLIDADDDVERSVTTEVRYIIYIDIYTVFKPVFARVRMHEIVRGKEYP